jgi:RNA polymerase sigma factor (sigma-70 family)
MEDLKVTRNLEFNDLAKQYEPMINKILRSLQIFRNKEEFIQLGLIGLWEASIRYNPEKGNFTNYAYTYIKGLFMTEMTKSNKHEDRSVYPADEFWFAIEDPNPTLPFEKEFLATYCNGLTENQTKWFLYTCQGGLSVKDIAKREKVSISAVKAWRKGAKTKLRKNLHTLSE